ncbi:hypothetical protein [Streptomyces sp. NPDC056069]|uniref:hypothetical protein n=1 Tax=Streptomyces sp. NPDC056069 TaxID=3345702 RepID=UPI0035DC48C5
MAHLVLLTLSVLAGVVLGYGAGTVFHRHRTRHRAAADRLICGTQERDLAALRTRLADRKAADTALTEACSTIDAAYARTRHSQEGGPTP